MAIIVGQLFVHISEARARAWLCNAKQLREKYFANWYFAVTRARLYWIMASFFLHSTDPSPEYRNEKEIVKISWLISQAAKSPTRLHVLGLQLLVLRDCSMLFFGDSRAANMDGNEVEMSWIMKKSVECLNAWGAGSIFGRLGSPHTRCTSTPAVDDPEMWIN